MPFISVPILEVGVPLTSGAQLCRDAAGCQSLHSMDFLTCDRARQTRIEEPGGPHSKMAAPHANQRGRSWRILLHMPVIWSRMTSPILFELARGHAHV